MSLSPILITLSGTTTTYLPLSTAYPSQASCSSLFINPSLNGLSDNSQLFAFDPSPAQNLNPACLPPEATLWWNQNPATDVTTRTELGGYKMVCPEAYKTVAMSVLDESRTRVGCCPSGYNFVTWATPPNPQQCNSPLPAGTVTYMQAVPSGTWTPTTLSLASPSSIWGVQINGLLFAKPSPTGVSIITSMPSPSNSASSDSDSSTHDSGLARGAKIGIGVGSAFGAVVLCVVVALGVLGWRRKRRRGPMTPSQVAIGPEEEQERKEVFRVRTEERTEEQCGDGRRHGGMG